ncbi:MAG: transaldolase [Bacteroidales bacterium]|jgi:transaldolase|nr:transaldolase [Bacteroidales bacterium]
MKATQLLHNMRQSIWLDNITRDHLDNGTITKYISELSVTGLTSNPTIFEKAIKESRAYENNITSGLKNGKSAEDVFFDLALEDLIRAADLFLPVYEKTNTIDGWVSLEVSPLLAYDTQSTLKAARDLYTRAGRPNLFIKIPGTREGLPAVEEAIFSGVPVNVTLLFSREHYLAAAEAWLRGIERRLDAGLDPNVGSVASLFVSRWDGAVTDRVTADLKNRLGIAMAKRTYKASVELMNSPRWKRIIKAGVNPQRLLFASTGTKDPMASDILYVNALPAADTVNTMPEATLLALSRYDKIGPVLSTDGGDCEEVLSEFVRAGIDLEALAARLQEDGAKAFVRSWNELLAVIDSKSKTL